MATTCILIPLVVGHTTGFNVLQMDKKCPWSMKIYKCWCYVLVTFSFLAPYWMFFYLHAFNIWQYKHMNTVQVRIYAWNITNRYRRLPTVQNKHLYVDQCIMHVACLFGANTSLLCPETWHSDTAICWNLQFCSIYMDGLLTTHSPSQALKESNWV